MAPPVACKLCSQAIRSPTLAHVRLPAPGRPAGTPDPQLAHRGSFAEIHDGGGSFRALNPPFRMSGSEAAAKPFVAALGEHSEAVLAELGYTPAEITALAEAGVIATPAA